MSASDASDPATAGRSRYRRVLTRRVFGDRVGVALFLGSLAFFGLTWRLDVFMTDSITVVNGLGALAHGHVGVQDPVLGASLGTPGMSVVGGEAIARNFGEIVLALPVYLLLRAVEVVANLHVALVAGWHLVVLCFAMTLGRLLDRPRWAALVGSAFVLASFVANLALARELPDFVPYVASLQLLTLLVAGLSVVVCYRLLASVHDRLLGTVAAAGLALATPLGFWAAFPKRHVFTGFAVLVILFAVHRSRTVPTGRRTGGIERSTWYRGLAYATVGLYAWIHAGEALFMLAALALVDLPTAPRLTPRSLAAIGVVFGLSLVPMALTNLALSGDVFRPPRLLPNFDPGSLNETATSGDDSLFPGASGAADGSGSGSRLLTVLGRASGMTVGGIETLLTDHEGVFRTYVRSRTAAAQSIPGSGGQLRYAAANLSVLESMPLATGLVALLAVGLEAASDRLEGVRSRVTATDALAVVMAVTFAILYAQRLPLVAQYTQRYLFVLYPLAVYGLVRLAPTRQSLADHWRLAGGTYAATVLIGGQLVFGYVVAADLAVSEAVQFHALVNLALGAVLAITLSVAVLGSDRDRPAAIALGMAAGAGTVFLVLAGVVYFPIGRYALPVVEVLQDAIAAA